MQFCDNWYFYLFHGMYFIYMCICLCLCVMYMRIQGYVPLHACAETRGRQRMFSIVTLPYSLELRAPISFSPSNPTFFILFSTAIAGTCGHVWHFNVGALTCLPSLLSSPMPFVLASLPTVEKPCLPAARAPNI